MSSLKKLKVGSDQNSLPPAQITLNKEDVKQIKLDNGDIIWGRYKITNTQAVSDFISNYCSDFTLKFVDPDNANSLAALDIPSSRDYNLNNTNICYHNENMECHYALKFPYYFDIDTASGKWNINYDSFPILGTEGQYTNSTINDFKIKTYEEDPTQEWPILKALTRNGELDIKNYSNLAISSINRIKSPYAKAPLGKIALNNIVYYGDILEVVWTNSIADKLPLNGKTYTLELKGDGVNTSGTMIQDTNFKNQYLFSGNQKIPLDIGGCEFPLYLYTNVSWLNSSAGGYSILNGRVMHHPLIRGEQIPVWLCCNTETFNVSGAGIEATVAYYAANDYRKYSIYDTSKPLYSGDIISRSNGNPFINVNGQSILSTTFTLNHDSKNSSGNIVAKPTHCYIAYIHNNKIYKINLLDNSNSLVNFTLTWSPNSSYLEANAHYEELHLMLPRTVITAPLHIAGRYEVSTAIQVLDESQSSAMQETFSYSGTFTKLTNGVTLQDGMTWFSEWGRQVNEEYSAVCSTEYKIYDSNNNLIHTGAFRWETVGVTSTRD